MKWQIEDKKTKYFVASIVENFGQLNSFYIMAARPIPYEVPFGNTLVECLEG